jgi:hypothetical protein
LILDFQPAKVWEVNTCCLGLPVWLFCVASLAKYHSISQGMYWEEVSQHQGESKRTWTDHSTEDRALVA